MVFGGNGYFLFDRSFVEGVAAANNYDILYSAYNITANSMTPSGSNQQFNIPLQRELIKVIDFAKVSGIGISVVFRKTTDADFQFPYQGHYLSEKQHHLGFRQSFLPDPPGYSYIPVSDTEGGNISISTRKLFKLLVRRIINRAKRSLG